VGWRGCLTGLSDLRVAVMQKLDELDILCQFKRTLGMCKRSLPLLVLSASWLWSNAFAVMTSLEHFHEIRLSISLVLTLHLQGSRRVVASAQRFTAAR
jgi:hypothetical protein